MVIFDTGYAGFEYEPTSQLRRIAALARREFLQIFRTRLGVLLFIVCCIYVVVYLLMMQAALSPMTETMARIGEGVNQLSDKTSPYSREFYMGYATQFGFVPYLILSSLVGVRAISGDRVVNALEIYWTRGITPLGYFLGKWLGMSVLLAAVFLAGPILLWLWGLLSAPDLEFARVTAGFMPGVALALVAKCLVLGFLPVCFSTIARTPNATTFLWLLLHGLTYAVVQILEVLHEEAQRHDPERAQGDIWFPALSPWDAMVRIERQLAGINAPNFGVVPALISLLVLSLVMLPILRRTLRSTEAIG